MKRNDNCTFCESKSSKCYGGKPVCDKCLDELTEWSKHLKVIDALKEIDSLYNTFNKKAYEILHQRILKVENEGVLKYETRI